MRRVLGVDDDQVGGKIASQPGQPGPFGPGGGGFQGGFPGGFPMMPMMGGASQIAATPTTVYVLRGNTLYSFDARTLRPMGRTTIEPPRPHTDDRLPAPPPPADER